MPLPPKDVVDQRGVQSALPRRGGLPAARRGEGRVRVRKEMGADIAGACGQLALTLPSPSESQRRCVCVVL